MEKSKEISGIKINSYRDLIVWQKAHDLAMELYGTCSNFPRSDEASIVKRQLFRAALSVPANIVEGYGGHKGRSYLNFLTISRRSATELDYWLLFAKDVRLIDMETYEAIKVSLDEIIALLSSIINSMDVKLRDKV